MSARVEKDPKFAAFLDRLKEAKGTSVFIGVLGSGKAQEIHKPPVRKRKGESDSGHAKRAAAKGGSTRAITQVDIASWNEFGVTIGGVVHVPERSFLRGTIDRKHAEITKRAAKELPKAFAGKQSVAAAFERVGIATVGLIQDRIAEGIAPGNDAKTIERKGSSKPLIDSGQLRSSITYEVRS